MSRRTVRCMLFALKHPMVMIRLKCRVVHMYVLARPGLPEARELFVVGAMAAGVSPTWVIGGNGPLPVLARTGRKGSRR